MGKMKNPTADGYRMPGEFETHRGCLMIWPKRPGSWIYGAKGAREAFSNVACAIAESEEVYMLAAPDVYEGAQQTLWEKQKDWESLRQVKLYPIHVVEMESDDAWARDVGPTFVKNEQGEVRGVDWQFNAWGGTVDGLYAKWDKDDAVAARFCEYLGVERYDARPFVLEGGSIHSDGEGTVIVTEACLLSEGRNPSLSKKQIEDKLKMYLGAKKIIWLPNGIYLDETNEHVDNVCAFVKPAEVVLAWTDDVCDPQYRLSMEDYEVLQRETDAKGRPFVVHKLPIPKNPVCITKHELDGFVFEPGEDVRKEGERLAASYANFYIANRGIIVPQFGDENDATAVDILQNCFPDRTVYPVYARDIIVGGGNIHCITQQVL